MDAQTSKEVYNQEYDSYGILQNISVPLTTSSNTPSNLIPNTVTDSVQPSSISSGQMNSQTSLVNGYLQSSNFKTGVSGWQIDADGNVEFSSGTFRGSLVGNTISIPNATSPLFSVDSSGNVIVNSLRRNDFHWFTMFESIDGYSKVIGAGNIICNPSSTDITTGAVNTDSTELQKVTRGTNSQFSWDKNRSLKTLVRFGTDTNQFMRIVTGDASTILGDKIGFSVQDNTLYGIVANGSAASSVALQTISASNIYNLSFVYTSGSNVKFYVNGVFSNQLTTNLPSGTSSADWLLDIYLKTNANEAKEVNVSYWDVWQAN